MNEKKPYLQILKFASYAIAVLLFVTILWKSKTFFEKNYNKHEILESDSNLYKVENEHLANTNSEGNIELIEQQPIEIHTEVTDVVTQGSNETTTNAPAAPVTTAATTAPAAAATTPTPTQIEAPSTPTSTAAPAAKKPAAKKTEPKKPAAKKTEPKKTKKVEKVKKPQTLVKEESVSKSVANNPLFYSYVVQVGAFSKAEEAKKYQAKIASIKSVAGFKVETANKNDIHKVFIGYFENHKLAENLCITLKNENVQCFVTKL